MKTKPKRGRPTLPEVERLSECLVIRLTAKELKSIQYAAKMRKKSVSEVARERLLEKSELIKSLWEHIEKLNSHIKEQESKDGTTSPSSQA